MKSSFKNRKGIFAACKLACRSQTGWASSDYNNIKLFIHDENYIKIFLNIPTHEISAIIFILKHIFSNQIERFLNILKNRSVCSTLSCAMKNSPFRAMNESLDSP